MRRINFSLLRNNADIALTFGCSEYLLNRILQSSPQARPHYRKMLIPKKNKRNRGKFRVVYSAVNPTLELLQKNIATALDYSVDFPDYVQGFVRKRSISTNAQQHLSKKYILNIDITNFFESINFDKVVSAFLKIGCTPDVAQSFATICTLNGFLPQGASSSPILANLVCSDMDVELHSLATNISATYTRYADDITFSGDVIPKRLDIEAILSKNNFDINNDKYKIMKRGQNQYVTGLTVFDTSLARVPRKTKKYLRLVLYCAEKYGIENHFRRVLGKSCKNIYLRNLERKKLKGWIDFINSIEPIAGKKFKDQWDKLSSRQHEN